MGGYYIWDIDNTFDNRTKYLIKEHNIDKNHNGYIDDDNGELQDLLSKTGASDIQELSELSVWRLFGKTFAYVTGAMAGAAGVSMVVQDKKGNRLVSYPNAKWNFEPKVSEDKFPSVFSTRKGIRENISIINANRRYYLDRCINAKERHEIIVDHVRSWGDSKWLNKNTLKVAKRFLGVGAALMLCGFLIPHNKMKYYNDYGNSSISTQVQPQPKPVEQPAEHQEIKTKFEEGFKALGVSEDTELKEYTPQKGEYWISILKAKYGVDEKTAQKMANKIKEMVYDDAKASKQTPVMYLPEIWTFEGKTYRYNNDTKADKTEKYSDEVKTEMGKMSKDLKY